MTWTFSLRHDRSLSRTIEAAMMAADALEAEGASPL
jgi:hypothetical protein